MDKTHEEIFKAMGRIEGLARAIKEMARDGEAIPKIEQQTKAIQGILDRAKFAPLRSELEAAKIKDVDALIERIKKLTQ